MTDTMVDVLIYLYENYMDGETPPPVDHNDLLDELNMAGFPNPQVEKAIQWLDELALLQQQPSGHPPRLNAMRVYTDIEQQRLDIDCRGYLLFLEQNELLDPATRELVIERTMALDTPLISEEELKWTVLLVLMNQPGREIAFARMEELVYNEQPAYLH
jgi:Smg protein